MRDALIGLAALAVVLIGGGFLFRRRGPGTAPLHVPSPDGTFTLTQPRKNAVLLGVAALVPTVLLGVVTYQGRTGGGIGFLFGVAATAAAAFGVAWLVAYSARARLVVRDTGIEKFGVFSRRLIGWTSVARIVFNPAEHWFFITLSDGSRLWVPVDVPGIGDFARLALRRVRPAVLAADGPVVGEVLDQLAGLALRGRVPADEAIDSPETPRAS